MLANQRTLVQRIPCRALWCLYIGPFPTLLPEEMMPRLSRRRFVGWIGALGALLGARRVSADMPRDGTQPAALPPAPLAAVAAAVLPSDLGADGTAKAVREFTKWVAEYRAGAEILHGYGTDELTSLPALPVAEWRRQLAALDAAATSAHGRAFPSLSLAERQGIIRQALAGRRVAGMPEIGAAPHVAVALLSHFYGSADATDLCYGVQIGAKQCRPLVHNGRPPLPLARGGRA